jgi:hypothetical protein
MGIIALGDFSWHIPATQVVIAMMLGTLLARGRRPEPPESSEI